MNNTMIVDNTRVITPEIQALIIPKIALDILKEGNSRFMSSTPLNRDYNKQVDQTAGGQHPFAVVLSCIDSRIPTEIVFDQGIGDIFNARIAGNFVNEDILGSMEFACKLAGASLIVVMGHTSCGAVKGACDKAELGNLTRMLSRIAPAVNATATAQGEERNSKNTDFVNRVAVKNVELTLSDIRNQSTVLDEMLSNGEIGMIGAMYDVSSGKVEFFQQHHDQTSY